MFSKFKYIMVRLNRFHSCNILLENLPTKIRMLHDRWRSSPLLDWNSRNGRTHCLRKLCGTRARSLSIGPSAPGSRCPGPPSCSSSRGFPSRRRRIDVPQTSCGWQPQTRPNGHQLACDSLCLWAGVHRRSWGSICTVHRNACSSWWGPWTGVPLGECGPQAAQPWELVERISKAYSTFFYFL